MNRYSLSAVATGLLLVATAAAQTGTATTPTTTPPTTDSLIDQTPTENLKSVRSRAPGVTIQASLARHQELIDDRVNGARSGNFDNSDGVDDENTTGSTTGTTGSTSDLTGGLGDLSGLLSLFGLGGIDVNGLLGGLGGTGTGTGVTTTGTSGTTTTTGNASTNDALNNFTPANGTEFTLEDLIRLRDQVEGTAKTSNAQTTNAIGGAIGRLPEFDPARAQTATTDRSFRLRLADRLVSTTFVAVNAALRLRPVIDLIKDGLRPLFFPMSTDNGNNGGNGGNDGGDDVDDGIGGIGSPGGGGGGSVMGAPLLHTQIVA